MTAARVAGLWRYPVKSMAGEPLETAEVGWHGVEGDRRWAFIRPGLERSGFPWLTMRERPAMGHYRPSTSGAVRTPSGEELDVTDPALAAELGDGVRLIKQDVGVFDSMPLSLITAQAIAGIRADLDVRRFRPNLLVDADGEFPEDEWVGAVLRIGGMRVRVDRRDPRCVMVNIDPVTTERDPAILRAIARDREACLGVYGTVVEPGRVTVGDPVILEP